RFGSEISGWIWQCQRNASSSALAWRERSFNDFGKSAIDKGDEFPRLAGSAVSMLEPSDARGAIRGEGATPKLGPRNVRRTLTIPRISRATEGLRTRSGHGVRRPRGLRSRGVLPAHESRWGPPITDRSRRPSAPVPHPIEQS